MTKKKAAVWIILFALMITGPRVIYYFAEPHISEENTENRQLAEKPAPECAPLGLRLLCTTMHPSTTATITTTWLSGAR